MLVHIRMGTNMAAGKQQKHLSLSFATNALIHLSRNVKTLKWCFYRESPPTHPIPERKEKGRMKGQSRIRDGTHYRTGKNQGTHNKPLGEHIGAHGEHHEGSTWRNAWGLTRTENTGSTMETVKYIMKPKWTKECRVDSGFQSVNVIGSVEFVLIRWIQHFERLARGFSIIFSNFPIKRIYSRVQ